MHDPAHDASPAPTLARGTARTTGLLYLALAITGMLGYLLVRTNLLVPDDPAATMANLLDRELAITPLAASAADAAGQVQLPYLIMALTMPASIGEFWMVGYLLWRGLRRPAVPSPNRGGTEPRRRP